MADTYAEEQGRDSVLPARIDELERVQLELQLVRTAEQADHLRRLLTDEEAAQQELRHRIERAIGGLRQEAEQLRGEAERLEHRLTRLSSVGRLISDEELDRVEERNRAREAAWWAEWRHRQADRPNARGEFVKTEHPDDITIRQLYRALARLVHPDLASDARDRARREAVMRLANAAREARDRDQLRQLLSIWARPEEGERPRGIDTLRARVAQRRVEINELRRHLKRLRQSTLGRLLRRGDAEIGRYLRHEEARLRRDLAMQRLRRRRALRQLEERKRDLGVPAGE